MNVLQQFGSYMGSRKPFLPISLVLSGLTGLVSLLPFIFVFIIFIPYGILHYKTAMQMKQIKKGKELNIILAQTARNMLIYGIATTIALVSL